MITVRIVDDLLKFLSITLCALFIHTKILGFKSTGVWRKIVSVLFSLVFAAVCAALNVYIGTYLILLLAVVAVGGYCSLLAKTRIDLALTIAVFAQGISFVLYFVVTITVGLVFGAFFPYSPDNPVPYVVMLMLQFPLTYAVFSIRRFRSGFAYLMNKYTAVFGLLFVGLVMLLAALISGSNDILLIIAQSVGVVLCGIGIAVWIRRGITMFYRDRMRERTIEQLEAELRKKEGEIERLGAENEVLSAANHRINHRLTALEEDAKKLAFYATREVAQGEIAPEYADIAGRIKELGEEYARAVDKVPRFKSLPSTKIPSIDALLASQLAQATEKAVELNLKVSGSIPYMVGHVVPVGKLETMLGDHIADAVIAVESGGNSYRSVLVLLGMEADCYALTVFDSGVEFDIDTLLSLGEKRVTTHRDTGGSGIGFMTTFETMRETRASLVITERSPPSPSAFTKSVSIRFDGKNEYRIESYRADAIRRGNGRKIAVHPLPV